MPSHVWKYFTRSSDKTSATCNLCDKQFAYKGTTSNLLNHLNIQHPSANTTNDTPKKQVPMTSFLNSPRKTKTDSDRITQAIADMIVADYVPLSIVEGEGFRNLMSIVAPDYTVPCRKTVRTRIQRRYDVEREALTSELSEVKSASITTDTWTSNSTESFITVTEHHVTDAWELKSNVLLTRAMPERHTGENLANRLKDSVREFNLKGKVDTCVHDNARNMDCAGNMCDEWGDLGCFGHTLQLCLKPAMELTAVSKVVAKCRKLVGHFKHSTTLTAEMGVRQKAMAVPQHSLVQDVPTRWNSTYGIMARLVEQRRVLTDILLDTAFTKRADAAFNLKESEWTLISELCTVLKPFATITEYMSTESSVSVSEIYPIVCGLVNKRLAPSADDSSIASKVKEAIKDELVRRYEPESDDASQSTAALGALLDPRYKKLVFFSSTQRKLTHSELESRMDELPLRLPSGSKSDDCVTPAKRRKLDFLDFGSPDNAMQDELHAYISKKPAAEVDPLEWWRENERRFPTVAVVAKSVLCVPATSVPSKRIFSSSGLLLNKLRNRLSSDIVDCIIFLNKNKVNVVATKDD